MNNMFDSVEFFNDWNDNADVDYGAILPFPKVRRPRVRRHRNDWQRDETSQWPKGYMLIERICKLDAIQLKEAKQDLEDTIVDHGFFGSTLVTFDLPSVGFYLADQINHDLDDHDSYADRNWEFDLFQAGFEFDGFAN